MSKRKDFIMTLDELYEKVLANDELKQSLAAAAEKGELVAWAAEQGVETTEEELRAYAYHAQAKTADDAELSDDELAEVAGGWNPIQSVVTTQTKCF